MGKHSREVPVFPPTGLPIPTNCILVRIVPKWVTRTKRNEFLNVTQKEFFYLNLHAVYIFKQELEERGFTLLEYIQSWVPFKLCCFLRSPQQWIFGMEDYYSISLPFISVVLLSICPNMPWVDPVPVVISNFSSNHISPPIPPHVGKSKSPPFQSSSWPCFVLSSYQILYDFPRILLPQPVFSVGPFSLLPQNSNFPNISFPPPSVLGLQVYKSYSEFHLEPLLKKCLCLQLFFLIFILQL